MNKFKFINTAKAILILLVVTWHFHYTSNPLPFKNIIYTFHVPAFLIITGFLLQPSLLNENISLFAKKTISPLTRAYIFFSFISVIILSAKLLVSNEALSTKLLLDSTKTIIYGVAAGDYKFEHGNWPLWYFTFLITSLLSAYILRNIKFKYTLPSLLLIQTLIEVYHEEKWPWNVDIFAIGALFLLTGVKVREYCQKHPTTLKPKLYITYILLGLSLTLFTTFSLKAGSINYNGGSLGFSAIYAYFTAILGTFTVIVLSILIPSLRVVNTIGRNTLLTFCLHFPFVLIASKIAKYLNLEINIISAILISLLICIFLAYSSELIKNPLNSILGK